MLWELQGGDYLPPEYKCCSNEKLFVRISLDQERKFDH
jgi:hypothetical protein